MSIIYENLPVDHLTDKMLDRMFTLFNIYFIYEKEHFIRDMKNKDKITLIIDHSSNTLVGFSSYDCIEYNDFAVLFSGSTVVDEQYRSESALMEGFVHICADTIKAYGNKPIYWHLISMGFRTYRFLPLFFNKYYPSCDGENFKLKMMLDMISNERFSNDYNLSTGIVSIPDSEKLRPEHAVIPKNRMKNKHVQFFLNKNPHYANGNELSCIAELSVENMRSIPQRMLRDMLDD